MLEGEKEPVEQRLQGESFCGSDQPGPELQPRCASFHCLQGGHHRPEGLPDERARRPPRLLEGPQDERLRRLQAGALPARAAGLRGHPAQPGCTLDLQSGDPNILQGPRVRRGPHAQVPLGRLGAQNRPDSFVQPALPGEGVQSDHAQRLGLPPGLPRAHEVRQGHRRALRQGEGGRRPAEHRGSFRQRRAAGLLFRGAVWPGAAVPQVELPQGEEDDVQGGRDAGH
mmetsp:Transcript_57615/g.150092  ORF Transcript_57615/g.150092 Transcript_57615/m.150092 type:complete len:227 (-) Transcript_57615:554-1234(-)